MLVNRAIIVKPFTIYNYHYIIKSRLGLAHLFMVYYDGNNNETRYVSGLLYSGIKP